MNWLLVVDNLINRLDDIVIPSRYPLTVTEYVHTECISRVNYEAGNVVHVPSGEHVRS